MMGAVPGGVYLALLAVGCHSGIAVVYGVCPGGCTAVKELCGVGMA